MSNAEVPSYSQLKALGQRILSRLMSLDTNKADTKYVDDAIAEITNNYILPSSTEGSTKKFRLLVDDDGRLITEEIA